MNVKTEALVIRTVRYGDNRLIVDLLTLKEGRMSFMVNVPTSGKARMKKQLFQPLTSLLVAYDHRMNVRLQHLRDVAICYPYTTIPFDPSKIALTLFLSEFLYYATRGEQGDAGLFNYLSTALRWLDVAKEKFANFHLVTTIHLARYLGFYPNLHGYRQGSYFDLRSGCFTTVAPLHHDFLDVDDAARMLNIMRINFDNMRFFRFSHDERNRCLDIILLYYRIHVPEFPELRSIEVLRQVFD